MQRRSCDRDESVANPIRVGDRTQAHSPGLSVLVVGTDDWAIEQSAAALRSAGHRVLRCHEAGENPFPCNALRPNRVCPLDAGVEVVVTSRASPTAAPAPSETGVICSLHAQVPLVVTGISRGGPFTAWAAKLVPADGDLSAACVVAAGRVATHSIALAEGAG